MVKNFELVTLEIECPITEKHVELNKIKTKDENRDPDSPFKSCIK